MCLHLAESATLGITHHSLISVKHRVVDGQSNVGLLYLRSRDTERSSSASSCKLA